MINLRWLKILTLMLINCVVLFLFANVILHVSLEIYKIGVEISKTKDLGAIKLFRMSFKDVILLKDNFGIFYVFVAIYAFIRIVLYPLYVSVRKYQITNMNPFEDKKIKENPIQNSEQPNDLEQNKEPINQNQQVEDQHVSQPVQTQIQVVPVPITLTQEQLQQSLGNFYGSNQNQQYMKEQSTEEIKQTQIEKNTKTKKSEERIQKQSPKHTPKPFRRNPNLTALKKEELEQKEFGTVALPTKVENIVKDENDI